MASSGFDVHVSTGQRICNKRYPEFPCGSIPLAEEASEFTMVDSKGIIMPHPTNPSNLWESHNMFNSNLSITTQPMKRTSSNRAYSISDDLSPALFIGQFEHNRFERVYPECCHLLRDIYNDKAKSVSVGHLDCLQATSPDLPFRWKSVKSEMDLTPTAVHKTSFGSPQTDSSLKTRNITHIPTVHSTTGIYDLLVEDSSIRFRCFSHSMDSNAQNEAPFKSGSNSPMDSKHVILPGCSNFEEELVREVAHFELCDFLITQLERINATSIDSDGTIDLESISQCDWYQQSTTNYGAIDLAYPVLEDEKQNLPIQPSASLADDEILNHNNPNLQNINLSLERNTTTSREFTDSQNQPLLFYGPSMLSNKSATSLAVNMIRQCQEATLRQTSSIQSKKLSQELRMLEQCMTRTCDFDWAHRTGPTSPDAKSRSSSDINQSDHAKSLPESLSRTSTMLSFTKSVFERTTSPKKKLDENSTNSGPTSSSGLFSLSTNQMTNSEGPPTTKQSDSKTSSSTNTDLLVSRSRYVLLPPHYSYLQQPNIVTISKNLNRLSSLYLGNPLAQSRIQLLTSWSQEGINPNFFRSPVCLEQLGSKSEQHPMPKAICASLPYGLLTNPPIPKSKRKTILANQNNRCAGCGIFVETRCLKRMRFCEFFGRFFCCVCHSNTLMTLPGNLLSNWDFRMLPVSNFARDRLNQLHHQPLLRTLDFNRQTIAKQINFMDCLSLRRQGSRMLPFMQFCEDARNLMIPVKKLPQHWLGTPEFWSMADLHTIQNGQMASKLRDVLNPAVNHLISCTRCRAQGFICEVCHSGQILFPFGQSNTVSCPSCSACYHRACLRNPQPETCPRCLRRSSKRKLNEQTRSLLNQSDKRQSSKR